MKEIFKPVVLFITLLELLFFSCAGDSEFQQRLKLATTEKTGVELFNALLELDQQYPDKLQLKTKLGEMLLNSGDVEKARTYFKKAEQLTDSTSDSKLKQEPFYYLGIISYIQGDAKKSLAYAEKALSMKKDDSLSYFLKARSLYQLGSKDKAFDLYNSYWPKDKQLMTKEDLNFYFDGVIAKQDYKRAIEILDNYQLLYEYIIGQGVQASTFYEKQKDINRALVAACMDLEYLRYLGSIDDKKLFATLDELQVKIADNALYPKPESRKTLTGIRSFFQGKWADAEKIFEKLTIKHPFFQYMQLVCEFETKGASQEDLQSYVKLEPYFKGLPAYYYHFWRGMKKGQGQYSFQTAKAVIEKCILLANHTRFADETRRELGRLLGLGEADGQKILLGPELDAVFNSIVAGKDINQLDPVIELVALPDNVYEMAAVLMLRQLQTRVPRVKTFLDKKAAAASGRLKDRLTMVLKG